MFGALTFLPLYLQVVRGASPTGSGLLLVPLMVGLLVAGILSGRWISNHGRYRRFPIAGSVPADRRDGPADAARRRHRLRG